MNCQKNYSVHSAALLVMLKVSAYIVKPEREVYSLITFRVV